MKTTSLTDIREFLGAHGCLPPPWESADRVVDRLFLSLCDKKDDPKFQSGLKDLMGRLQDRRFNQAVLQGSRVLGEAKLSDLVDDLYQSINQSARPTCGPALLPAGRPLGSPARRWVGQTVSASALLAFLLIFSAAGCITNGSSSSGGDDDNDTFIDDDTTPPNALCDEAKDHHVTGYDGEVYCQLVDFILAADISDDLKQSLIDCLPNVDEYYRIQLLELFQNMSEQQISDYLESNHSEICSTLADDDTYYGDDDH